MPCFDLALLTQAFDDRREAIRVQLSRWMTQGKVIGLREMINWCLQNPLEGEPLALDSKEMIALEAYATWERRGVALDPGKH